MSKKVLVKAIFACALIFNTIFTVYESTMNTGNVSYYRTVDGTTLPIGPYSM